MRQKRQTKLIRYNWRQTVLALGYAIAIVISLASQGNPQASEDPQPPAPSVPTQTVRVEQGESIPWELIIGVVIAAIGIVPQLFKSNVERIQMQVSKDAEKQKSLEENSRQIFLNYQQQVNDLNQRFKDYQLLEIEWRNRERSLDNDIDKLKAENMGLRSEISVLHIENAKLRSKLGMDSMPPKIVADVNLKSGESS